MAGEKIIGAGLCAMFLITTGFTHPGELDSNGRHYDRDTDAYHYHKNGKIIWEKTKKSKTAPRKNRTLRKTSGGEKSDEAGYQKKRRQKIIQ